MKKAKKIYGTKFIHILAPCPPGWRIDSQLSVEIARLATYTKMFPVYEVYNGEEYHINIEPKDLPVIEYLKLQGRFRHLNEEDVNEVQRRVDYEWRILLHKTMDERFVM